MPIYDVTMERTVIETHRIRAATEKDAIDRMRYKDSSKGEFLYPTEDDYEVEYYAVEVPQAEQLTSGLIVTLTEVK